MKRYASALALPLSRYGLVALALLIATACTLNEPTPAPRDRSGKKTAPSPEARRTPTRSRVVRGPEGVEIAPTKAWVFAYLEQQGIPYAEMGDGIARVRVLLEAQKIKPAGACRTMYLDDPNEVDAARCRYRVGFPVSADVLPRLPLRRVQMPAGFTARALHRGDYHEAFQLRYYERIPLALQKAGYLSAGPIEEIYRYAPDETDPTKWVTEVRYPVKKKGAPPAKSGPAATGPTASDRVERGTAGAGRAAPGK